MPESTVHDVTFHGLHKWHETMFEKLGWMVLAKEHGYSDKIGCYLNGCKRLQNALELKLTKIDEKERKDDIKILLNNTKILCTVAAKLLRGNMIKTHRRSNSGMSSSSSSSSSKKTLTRKVMGGGFNGPVHTKKSK